MWYVEIKGKLGKMHIRDYKEWKLDVGCSQIMDFLERFLSSVSLRHYEKAQSKLTVFDSVETGKLNMQIYF